MKKEIKLLAAIALSGLAANAMAEGMMGEHQLYIGGMVDWSGTGASVTDGGDKAEADSLMGGGVVIGYRPANLDGFRLEGSWATVSDDDASGNDNADLDIDMFEVNVMQEFDLGFTWMKPFVLAGIGYYDADLDHGSKINEKEVGYSLGAGIAFTMTDNVGMDVSYRYTDTGIDYSDSSVVLDSLNRVNATLRYTF